MNALRLFEPTMLDDPLICSNCIVSESLLQKSSINGGSDFYFKCNRLEIKNNFWLCKFQPVRKLLKKYKWDTSHVNGTRSENEGDHAVGDFFTV
jgi:hypothetical protein